LHTYCASHLFNGKKDCTCPNVDCKARWPHSVTLSDIASTQDGGGGNTTDMDGGSQTSGSPVCKRKK
jgi:hypothetical protein